MNNAAARLGLIPSMALADARAMYPALAAADADPQADAALLEAVADWCDRYTPLAGLDVPDGILLDITGCAHLFGGESALCRDLVEATNFRILETIAEGIAREILAAHPVTEVVVRVVAAAVERER